MFNLRIIGSTLIFACLFNYAQAAVVEKTTTTTTTVTPSTSTTTSAPTTTIAPSPSELSGKPIIITPVPSAKEEIPTPSGYVHCFNVEAGWYKTAWVPEHRICQYENAPGQAVTYEGVAWVGSYWSCTQYTGTTCTKWEWKPGHWVKTLEVY